MSRKALVVVALVFGITALSLAGEEFSMSKDRTSLLQGEAVLLPASEVSGNFGYGYEGSPVFSLVGKKFIRFRYDFYQGRDPILVGVVHAEIDSSEVTRAHILFAYYPKRSRDRLEIVSVGLEATFDYLDFAGGCRAIVVIENSNAEEISSVKVFDRKTRNDQSCFPLKEGHLLYGL